MKNQNRLVAALAAVMFMTAPAAFGADAATASSPGKSPPQNPSTAGDYLRGVKAWTENCERCHNMRDPKEFRDDQWHVIVDHMRVRAGLTGQTARDILTFLQRSN